MRPLEVYAVIDLGSSFIRGMIAHKKQDGRVSPISYEVLPTEGCIRHGAIYNLENTARKIQEIVERLNEKLEDNVEIKQLYIGTSALSLKNHMYVLERQMQADGDEITDETIREVKSEVATVEYPRQVIIERMEPYFEIDGKIEAFPVGVMCREFKAHVPIISIKDWIYNNIKTIVEDRLHLKLAGVLPSPLCEARISLSESQRNYGSIFVNLGGGSTSVVIYVGGVFRRLRVIPMGGDNITLDIQNYLRLSYEDAVKLKMDYASATTNFDRDKLYYTTGIDGISKRSIRISDVNRIVVARLREILVNVIEVIKNAGVYRDTQMFYLFSGGATQIKELDQLLKKEIGTISFTADVSPYIDFDNVLGHEQELHALIGITYFASDFCVGPIRDTLNDIIAPTADLPKREPTRDTDEWADFSTDDSSSFSAYTSSGEFESYEEEPLEEEPMESKKKEKKEKSAAPSLFARLKDTAIKALSVKDENENYDNDDLGYGNE